LLDLDAFAGEVAVRGRVNQFFTGRDTRQNLYQIALPRAEREITKLRNPLTVENVGSGQ